MMSSNDSTGNPLVLNSIFSLESSLQENETSPPRRTRSLLGHEVSTFCCCIPISWILASDDESEVHTKNSDISTVFLLLNYMIGSGIVVQAYAFSQSGIIVIIFEYIIIASLNYTGINLLVLCAEEAKIFDYSLLAESILGVAGPRLVDISICIGGAGSLLSYILIIGTMVTDVAGHCGEWYCDITFLTILPIAIFTLPLCLLRKFSHLAVASYISISVIAATVLLVIIGGPAEHPNAVQNVKLGSFRGSIRTIGDVVFALGYITAAFPSYNGMKNRNVPAFNGVSKKTMAIGATMCFFTGLAGYLSFGNDTKSNILENFHGPMGAVFKVALVVHLLLYIPGDFVIMRDSLLKLRSIDVNKMSDGAFLSFSLLCLSVITLVALLLQVFLSSTDSLAIVVDITGGIAGSMLYFIIPALCALGMFKGNAEIKIKSYVLLLFGCAIVVAVILSVILA